MVALPTRIFLTGFMGSGKSTVGPVVANVLGYDFIDLDAAIEGRAGRRIQDIFAEEGEAAFRRLEAWMLAEAARRERVVVALGGGALTFEDNLQLALSQGTVVYLRLTPEQLVQRLRRGRRKRPLLRDAHGRLLDEEGLRARVGEMLARREPYYNRAHLVIDVGTRRVGPTVDAVVKALRQG